MCDVCLIVREFVKFFVYLIAITNEMQLSKGIYYSTVH